jgi:hypothetical protein
MLAMQRADRMLFGCIGRTVRCLPYSFGQSTCMKLVKFFEDTKRRRKSSDRATPALNNPLCASYTYAITAK